MSSPTSHKSEPLDTVLSPSDPLAVEQDVARKLRIYGMVQALRRGRLPGNTQLDNALVVLRDMLTRRVETSEVLKASRKDSIVPLSEDGRTVVRDLRDIVETARQILRQKNTDEVIQDFIYHTSSVHVSKSPPEVSVSVSTDEARKQGETAVHHLRTLLRILLMNREVRKLLADSKILLRDLFAQTAVAAAEQVRPSALEMQGVDDAAPSQDWIWPVDGGESESEGRGTVAETRIMSGKNNGQANDQGESGEEGRIDQTKRERLSESKGETTNSTKLFNLNLKDRFWTLTRRVPAKHRAHVEKEYNDAKAYLQDEFPPERRDQFIWRLKKVVKDCQSTPSYQESVCWLLTLFRTYLSTAGALVTSHAAQTSDKLAEDPILARSVNELRVIAERGAGGKSLNDLIGALKVLWDDARSDEKMREWWEGVDAFLNKTILQPGYIASPHFTTQSRQLRTSGRFFFAEKYRSHTDALVDAAQAWSRAWLDDPLHVRFTEDWARFIRDLLFDEKGSLVFKSSLWKDMRGVILPGMLRKVGVFPIPRIEYVDDDLDLVIENLTLQGTNLFPKTIELMVQHYSKLSPLGSTKRHNKDEHRTEVTLKLSGIQADMRDVAFDYRRKSGIVLGVGKMRDSGLADIFIGGRGITIKVKLVNASRGAESRDGKDTVKNVFEVKNVHVEVEGLRFTIRESNHDFLYKALRPVATRLIKQQIIKVFSDGIHIALGYVDEQLAAVRAEMAKAQSTEGGSSRKVLRQLWHTRYTHISSKHKKDSAFRVVPKRESTLLPDRGHKRGWIRRQAEKDAEAATEGIGWRSEAFNFTL